VWCVWWCVWGAAADSGQALEQEQLRQRVCVGERHSFGGAARGGFADWCQVRAEAGHTVTSAAWDAVLVDRLVHCNNGDDTAR